MKDEILQENIYFEQDSDDDDLSDEEDQAND